MRGESNSQTGLLEEMREVGLRVYPSWSRPLLEVLTETMVDFRRVNKTSIGRKNPPPIVCILSRQAEFGLVPNRRV